MRLLAVALVALALSQGPGQVSAVRTDGLIVGQVLDGDTHTPIADAVVRLIGLPAAASAGMLTDADGRFYFSGLPARDYQITTIKPGYLNGFYGRRRPTGDPQPVALAGGERRGDATILMWKFATISGTVTDEAGEPMIGVRVSALSRRVGRQGARFIAINGAFTETDDQGTYRISLPFPGDYIVAIASRPTTLPLSVAIAARTVPPTPETSLLSTEASYANQQGQGLGNARAQTLGEFLFVTPMGSPLPPAPRSNELPAIYPTTYYPSTTNRGSAGVITLRSGDERLGVDFALAPTPSRRVSGRLVGPEGTIPPPTAIHLIPEEVSRINDAAFEAATTVSDASGAFSLLGVPPGQYVLTLLTALPIPERPAFWANQTVAVGETDVTGLVVPVQRALRTVVRFVFRGEKPAPSTDELRDYFRATFTGVTAGAPVRQVSMDASRAYIAILPGGSYRLTPETAPGWWPRAVRFNDRDVSDADIDLQSESELVVECTDRPSRVTGIVRDARGQPDLTAGVLVFPADRARWSSATGVAAVRAGRGGSFEIVNLPPGQYLAVAVDDAAADNWRDPSVMDALSRDGTTFSIAEGEQRTMDLRTSSALSGRSARARPAGREISALGLNTPIDPASSDQSAHGPFVREDDLQARDGAIAVPSQGLAVIFGRVVGDDGRTPVRRARVVLTSSRGVADAQTATTDDEGRFGFAGVGAGRIRLIASKIGFPAREYGATAPGRQGIEVIVAESDRRTDLTLVLGRGSVITGIVRDGDGQPVPNIQVRVLSAQYSNATGRPFFTNTSDGNALNALTDNRGVYRIWGLSAAKYLVMATFSAGQSPLGPQALLELRRPTAAEMARALRAISNGAGPPRADENTPPVPVAAAVTYAPVFYPGTGDAERAVVVTVGPAEERRGADIQLVPTSAARISGRITPTELVARSMSVSIGPPSSGVEVRDVTRSAPTAVIGSDGTFAFNGVPPGRYRLRVNTAGVAGRGGPSNAPVDWAQQDIVVDGLDVSVDLTLEPALTLSGRLVFDGAAAVPDPRTVQVSLRAVQPVQTGRGGPAAAPAARIGDDGTFSIGPVVPDQYRFSAGVGSPGSPWVVKSAISGERDWLDGVQELSPRQDARLVVTFTDRPSSLVGKLQDAAARPTAECMVIVFPAARSLWVPGSRRLQAVRPATDGAFAVTSLPAGEYLIAAVTDVEPFQWNDPSFLDQLAGAAVRVTVTDGQQTRQDLRIAR